MRRKRSQKEQIEDQPLTKVRKLGPRSSTHKRCYICELPNELLEKIVGYINFWHRPRLRKSCRRMRYICDSVLMHEFQSSIFQFSSQDPDGYEYAALTAIKDATWAYVINGFESIFCGSILPLIWNNTKFSPEPDKIKSFLKHFYKLTEEKIGSPNSQFSRLLYSITLMGLLKKFKNSRLLASILIPHNYWRIVLELRGPWVGVLWSTKSACQAHERNKLLMILCEIMIADSTHRAFKYVEVWECDSEIFVYGNDTSERSDPFRYPTTVFTFKISASTKVISLLKSCLEDSVVKWPKRLPKNEFVLMIDIACKEALKWGCCQVHHIEIGPYSDRLSEDAQEEIEDENLIRTASRLSSETVIEID